MPLRSSARESKHGERAKGQQQTLKSVFLLNGVRIRIIHFPAALLTGRKVKLRKETQNESFKAEI